jgi:hypothetical protein
MYPLHYSFWRAPSQEFPDQLEYMLIDPEKGRCISSVTVQANPIKRSAISVWYKQGQPNVFSTRLKLSDTWRDSFYRLEGDTIFWKWSLEGVEYPWIATPESEIPEWFFDRVQRSYTKMNAAEQGAAANP